ncbi:DUF1294 domain-containing protein [Bacillus marinisedimentorum]|uniref:DUF1294 domain-containing protein n=1 Tax=Bacillus marinisedimentorum TaxID=1821260 RepID=UPI000872EE9B|nr:DUF1294 domain-containing protein [Bacillus marinisedimentorum]
MSLTYLLAGWAIAVNITGFAIMGMDKRRAVKQRWRIPEKTIWMLSLFGGAAGVGAGMRKFRHKTKHIAFQFGVPVLLFFNMAAYIWLFVLIVS